MADFNRLASLVDGIVRNVNLKANSLVVGSLKIGTVGETEITKAILDNLITLQNGSDIGASLHHHDGRYFTETELGATTGATLVGAPATATNYTPTASTIQGHLSGINTALANAGSDVFSDSLFRIQDNGDATKQLAFEVSAIGTTVTRTIIMPNSDVNLGALTNSNIDAAAAIVRSKLASGTAFRLVSNDVSGVMSEAAAITAARALISDANGIPTHSAVTSVELGYLTGSTSSIQTQLGARLLKAGDTMSGQLNMGSNKIISLGVPTANDDAATKGYVDDVLNGLSWKTAVRVATTAQRALTGLGTAIDGVTLSSLDRVLVKNQSLPEENGIYVAVSGAWSRSADADTDVELLAAAVFVREGTVNADSAWTMVTDAPIVVGTDALSWVQFNGAGQINAGVGLSKTGNTLDVNLGAGISELPTDGIGIDVLTAGGLFLTVDGSTPSTVTGAQLSVLLDASTLARSGSGLKVADGGIANAQVSASAAIAYSKLNLTGAIVDADVSASAGIVYSKLSLTGSVVNADIAAGADIARTKIASGSASHVVINDGSGVLTSEARLGLARTAAGAAGSVLIGQGGSSDAAYTAISGDLTISSAGAAVVQKSGQLAVYVTFTAGESISAGDVVYLSTSVAGEVLKADADALSSCEGVIGIADQTVAAAASLRVQVSGRRAVTGTFTAGARGKQVYLSGTAGQATPTAPTALNSVVVVVGKLIDHATNEIIIQPMLVGENQ